MTTSTVPHDTSPLPATPTTVVIPGRWNGPRRFGNGGYSAGVFANAAYPGASARVVLRRPVPLDRRLPLVRDGGQVVVRAGRRLIAEVSVQPEARVLTPPVRPDLAAADDASSRYPWAAVRHALSECAVCSPHRRDGLGATPGVLEGAPDVLAAPFYTDSRLADPAAPDVVRSEFVWASLDCPSFPAADLVAGRVRLLGTIAVTRVREVFVGESLVVVGWTRSVGVRSVHTASALLDGDGEVVASAENVWVAPRRRF